MLSKSSAAKSAAISLAYDDLIRERACAKHLNISHRTLELWRRKGIVPYLRITPKSIRYCLPDILEALRNNYGQEVKK
jgi:predicted site-specific integrase-resolvase